MQRLVTNLVMKCIHSLKNIYFILLHLQFLTWINICECFLFKRDLILNCIWSVQSLEKPLLFWWILLLDIITAKRSRSAEKGKPSRSKDSDRDRDRDRDRGRERRRDRDRDDNSRDKDKKSRKEPHEDSRAAPSSGHSHHEDVRPSGSSSQSHQPDLRQMIVDKRDDTRQVTVVGDRVQQKETERKPREGKKER